jgi:hypothetical protein
MRLAILLSSLLFTIGCGGGSSQSRDQLLGQLDAAIEEPVPDEETSHRHSRLAMEIVEDGVLERMNRVEVEQAIGRGDPCSRHPRCAENGFADDDWFYTVGQSGGEQAPLIIVGFDREGRVDRTWYMRTH